MGIERHAMYTANAATTVAVVARREEAARWDSPMRSGGFLGGGGRPHSSPASPNSKDSADERAPRLPFPMSGIPVARRSPLMRAPCRAPLRSMQLQSCTR
eukprot:364323-Chlamydomonas_euryale.AAC.4